MKDEEMNLGMQGPQRAGILRCSMSSGACLQMPNNGVSLIPALKNQDCCAAIMLGFQPPMGWQRPSGPGQ